MRTNIKVSFKEEIEKIRSVDILLSGDTEIVQDIISSIPGKYLID